MTREETKKAIEVMQAYVDGKDIESRNMNDDIKGFFSWSKELFFDWRFESIDYRIKEDPRVIYCVPNHSVGDFVYSILYKEEGIVAQVDGNNFLVKFNSGREHWFGEKSSDRTPVWLISQIYRKPKEFVDLSQKKPFSWREKNIQWIRHKDTCFDVYKVTHLNSKGFACLVENLHDKKLSLESHLWIENLSDYEWSEDNKTWSKFE